MAAPCAQENLLSAIPRANVGLVSAGWTDPTVGIKDWSQAKHLPRRGKRPRGSGTEDAGSSPIHSVPASR